MLTQTDLYLLNTTLEIHPILLGELAAFSLNFNLVSGTSVVVRLDRDE